MKIKKTGTALFSTAIMSILILFLVAVAPEMALAASPFSTAATAFKADAVVILQIGAFIAVMAVGILCACGKIHKGWLAGCVLGIILIFGAEQFIAFIRGAAGV